VADCLTAPFRPVRCRLCRLAGLEAAQGQSVHRQGLTIIGASQIRNNASGPLGSNANIAALTANNRPISFTLIGCVDTVTTGDPSVALSGTSGQITMTELDCQFTGSVAVSGSVSHVRE
jgi:hypothetical protein